MKRLLTLAAIIPALLASCGGGGGDNPPPADGKGHIVLKATTTDHTIKKEISSRATPTDDFSTYYVKLNGPENKTVPYPSTGKIENLKEGSYTVTVMSHETTPNPAFDVQHYVGSCTAKVVADTSADATVECTQANAGVFFIYDASLKELGLDLVPTVTQGTHVLEYKNANKEAKGYFTPGNAVLTIKNGNEPWLFNGKESETLSLKTKELWEVTLAAKESEDGGINIKVTVEVIDTANESTTFTVSPK